MTNYPGYGINITDAVDYRTEYKKLIRDLAQYNEVAEPLNYSGLVTRTRDETIKYFLNNTNFVRSAEGDQANWQKHKYYERDIPMDTYAVGLSWTDDMMDDASAAEINAASEDVLRADMRLLAKLYFDTAVGGDGSGNYKGFWNGSTTEWDGSTLSSPNNAAPRWKNNTFTSSHNHYAATGSATIALSDFSTLTEQITEHGYGLNGRRLMFVSQNTAKDIQDMAGWTTAMTSNNVVNNIADEGLLSKVTRLQGWTIVVDDWMPDDYLYGQATDDPTGVIAMREPRNGGGLKFYKGPYEDYPFKESYYKRRCGMVVKNRGSGAVYQITSGSYTSVDGDYSFEA